MYCFYREATKHSLQQRRHQDRTLLTSLYPDAPFRQRGQLADIDMEEEKRLSLEVLIRLRSGQLAAAQELCQRLGQPWLSAALEGWRPYHDPNYAKEGAGEGLGPVEGNPNRDLWKTVCWQLAKEVSSVSYRHIMTTWHAFSCCCELARCVLKIDHINNRHCNFLESNTL